MPSFTFAFHGERPAGRAELLAKKGASGRMQRLTELVPIPWCGVKASEGFGKFRKVAAFWKNPEKDWTKFGKIQGNSSNFL